MRRAAHLLALVATAAAAGASAPASAQQSDAAAAACEAGLYRIDFSPPDGVFAHRRGELIAWARMRSRAIHASCRRRRLAPRPEFDSNFLGAPSYGHTRISCRIPEQPVLVVLPRRGGGRRPGSQLLVLLEGHTIVQADLWPGGGTISSSRLFCKRA